MTRNIGELSRKCTDEKGTLRKGTDERVRRGGTFKEIWVRVESRSFQRGYWRGKRGYMLAYGRRGEGAKGGPELGNSHGEG